MLEFPSQDSVLTSVNELSGSHVPFGEIVVTTELVLAILVVPFSESEVLTVVTLVSPRVRFGLKVVTGKVTEEVGFEVLISSFTDSATDASLDLVGEAINIKKIRKHHTKNVIV